MLPVVFNEKMFDDLFDSDFFGGRNPLYGRHAKNLMKTDIREKEDGYEMAVDLPGFNKDEIKVEIKDGYMTVSANKDLDKDEADKKGHTRHVHIQHRDEEHIEYYVHLCTHPVISFFLIL